MPSLMKWLTRFMTQLQYLVVGRPTVGASVILKKRMVLEEQELQQLEVAVLPANGRGAALLIVLSMDPVWAHRHHRHHRLARSGRPVTDGLCGRRSFASTPRARICASRKHLARLIGIAEQSVENMVLLLCAPSPSLAGTTGPSAVYGHG